MNKFKYRFCFVFGLVQAGVGGIGLFPCGYLIYSGKLMVKRKIEFLEGARNRPELAVLKLELTQFSVSSAQMVFLLLLLMLASGIIICNLTKGAFKSDEPV